MRRILRQIDLNDRYAVLGDAAGAIALFVLLCAGLYAPLIA